MSGDSIIIEQRECNRIVKGDQREKTLRSESFFLIPVRRNEKSYRVVLLLLIKGREMSMEEVVEKMEQTEMLKNRVLG